MDCKTLISIWLNDAQWWKDLCKDNKWRARYFIVTYSFFCLFLHHQDVPFFDMDHLSVNSNFISHYMSLMCHLWAVEVQQCICQFSTPDTDLLLLPLPGQCRYASRILPMLLFHNLCILFFCTLFLVCLWVFWCCLCSKIP